jgi:tRNA pseudouridine55 synthase
MATGVLVVAIGEATKLVPWLTAHDKAYVAEIALGRETDTLDADGHVVPCAPPSAALLEALAAPPPTLSPILADALARERERTTQVPPAYSAIKTQGERAFARARRGEVPELAPRPVCVHRVEIVTCQPAPPSLAIELAVAKGYYVRAFARDLAQSLGTGAHLTALRRLRSGPFSVEEAVSLSVTPAELRARLLPLAVAAGRALPVARLTETGTRDARCGRPVGPDHFAAPSAGLAAWLDGNGDLVAVGEADAAGVGRVVRGFVPA